MKIFFDFSSGKDNNTADIVCWYIGKQLEKFILQALF